MVLASDPGTQSDRNTTGSNLEHTRVHNRRIVLEIVRRQGPLSRADIARITGLTNQTISNIMEELLQAGFVQEGERIRNKKGQPAIPYSINPHGAWSLGFHVNSQAIVATLADLTGTPFATRQAPVQRPTATRAAPVMRALADALVEEAGIHPSLLLGAGLALPARPGASSITTVEATTLPEWDLQSARNTLRETLGCPVLIDNDAMAAAIGERLHGAAKHINSFAFLFLDEGLGSGIFLNGEPWRGESLNAGEIGHMIVDPAGKSCSCGNLGCLERYVSISAAREFIASQPGYQAGDEFTFDNRPEHFTHLSDWVESAAPRLATAVNILESILDPETIFLGGVVPEYIVSALIEKTAPLPSSVGKRENRTYPRLMAGSAGRTMVAHGAAALPISFGWLKAMEASY